ncbi:MAG TPA: SDR family NAD(P)-dependent oxidoreductase [Tepidisphaeraceae bacterium]
MSPTSRSFTREEQLAFARLSGEFNPIHLDSVAARRLLFGRDVLHGLQLALWAADRWLAGRSTRGRFKTFQVVYRRAVGVDEPVGFAIEESAPDRARVEVNADGASVLTAEFAWEADDRGGIEIPAGAFDRSAPWERSDAELRECAGSLALRLDRSLASQLFPSLARLMPADQLAAILATTRMVGMEAPGLHSICRSLNLSDAAGRMEPSLAYCASRYDPRFSLLDLRVEGPGLTGTVSTGIRPEPVRQASYSTAREQVGRDEFAGHCALVIGGSRGLGEAASKLLAAGGADVRLTWHRGEADAQRVVVDIRAGGGAAAPFQYDVLRDGDRLTELLAGWQPTLLCYFATPYMFAGSQGRFSDALFRTFCDVYVRGFHSTLRSAGEVKGVLYPSSTALDEVLPNLAEFAAAKSAGESLCRSLAAAQPGVRFHVPRFPRLATDQTATLLRVPAMDPIEPILTALRELTGTARVALPPSPSGRGSG